MAHDVSTDPGTLWSAWLQGSTQFWRAAPLGRCLTRQHAGLALSGEPELVMNWGMVDKCESSPLLLRELVATLREANLSAYLFFTSAAAPGLAETALELGLLSAGGSPLMARDAGPLPPPDQSIKVSVVRDESQLRLLSTIAAAAFGVAPAATKRAFAPMWLDLPDVDVFLGLDDGLPVSGCVTTRSGNWTGIWAMSTPPQRRRRGYCSALLSAVVEHHRPTTELFYLNATPMSEGIYRRLGFVTVDEAEEWDFVCP